MLWKKQNGFKGFPEQGKTFQVGCKIFKIRVKKERNKELPKTCLLKPSEVLKLNLKHLSAATSVSENSQELISCVTVYNRLKAKPLCEAVRNVNVCDLYELSVELLKGNLSPILKFEVSFLLGAPIGRF